MPDHDAAHLLGQRFDALFQRVTLVGEGEFGPVGVTGFGDTPSQRSLVGNPDDQAALAAHEARDFRHFLRPHSTSSGAGLPMTYARGSLKQGRYGTSKAAFSVEFRLSATCGPIDIPRSSMRLGGASASKAQVIGPMSFRGAQGTSCTIIDNQTAIDQTTITSVTISAPLRRHVSASSTVISGTATVTYWGPAEGIMSGSAPERTAPATRTGYPSAGCGPRTLQKPPRPRDTITAATAALNTN